MRSVSIGLIALALSLPAANALAQDVSTAKAMFDKGVQDMEAGKFDSGCPALQEGYRLDPRPGPPFTLARCFRKGGKTGSPVARYGGYPHVFWGMTPQEKG